MNIKINRFVAIFVIALVCGLWTLNSCYAGPGTTGATFLKLGVGSRPAAMGEAYAAISDDVNAIYWNPAGLSKVEGRQVSLIHTEWFQSIRYEHLGYCQPALGGTLGVGATFLWIDGIERRSTDTALPEGYIPARDLSISVSYARSLSEPLSIGLTIKGIHQQLDDRFAAGVAADLGLLCSLPDGFSFGMAIQNLGYQSAFISQQSPLPMNLKAGISSRFPGSSVMLAADINYWFMDNVFAVGGGIEWWLHPVFAIRGGYKYNTASTLPLGVLSGLTCGGGLKIGILNVDYAFVPYGDLGYTHRISLLAKF